jgi:hypothetical protein
MLACNVLLNASISENVYVFVKKALGNNGVRNETRILSLGTR